MCLFSKEESSPCLFPNLFSPIFFLNSSPIIYHFVFSSPCPFNLLNSIKKIMSFLIGSCLLYIYQSMPYAVGLFVNLCHLNAESPKKLVRSITWNRSNLSRSSSSKTFLAPGSKSSSTWSELGNDLIDDYEGMASGSLSQTLERLYAWEKKLYEEVKVNY